MRVIPIVFLVACGLQSFDSETPPPGDVEPHAWSARRLTNEQLRYTVLDRLGVDPVEALASLPPEVRAEGFSNTDIALVTTGQHVEGWAEVASYTAARADLAGWVACAEYACGEAAVDEVLTRLFRRPAEAREIGLYAGLLDVAQAEKLDFDEALRLVLEAGLQAPAFLYHLEDETPEGGGWRTVRDHALANRLSYLVWQSAPDDELQALADAGALADPEILDEQVVRMLADERARRSTDRFVRDWFALDGLLGIARSDLDDRTAASLHESAVRTWDHLVWERQEALGAVLDSEIVMVDDRAAEWMGLDEVDDWQTTTLPEGRRGALTWPGVLAAMSDRDIGGIVARGLFVREHIQCLGIADPPEELDLSAFRSHLGPDATERDYSDDRLANSGCAGCHLAFDPLAYALLPFDGSGRELADPEPADGWVPSATADVVYAGPEEFASLLPTTIEVERCLVAKPLQFALGRPIESSDGVLVDQISEGLTTGTWSDTVRTIVSHPAFSIVATDAERP